MNGMLAGVKTPDGKTISFGYDALGRRVSKTVDGTVRRFGWDGNVVLHEWEISEADRPRLITDGSGREEYDGTEKPENLVTWIYDGTSFTPVAKVTDGERYTIVHDYLGTPTQAYDSRGSLVWEMLLDVYGEVKECHGDRMLVPFRYQGQYEDEETGLYYNRFRYYSPQMSMYISSDPIGLAGNNPTLYGYVQDVNAWIDVWGLDCWKNAREKFWKNEARINPTSYSERNLARMRNGNAPQFTALVSNRKTGRVETRTYTLELHHRDIPQRIGGEGVHDSTNLDIVTPWQHEDADSYRHVGYDLIKIEQWVDEY